MGISMRRKTEIRPIRLAWLTGVLATLAATAALGQANDGSLVIPAEIEVRGRGWGQLANIDEVVDFLLSLSETVLMTSLLAFHPVNLGLRVRYNATELRKGMFIFALIGMLTGFLVVHHGYLIGFVIFGIGGLFRFRMESSSISDTGQLVIVALIGLAAGLDLPVMALIATVAAWIVVYAFGRAQTLALEVKFDEKQADPGTFLQLQEHLADKGFSVLSMAKTKFKPVAEYVLCSRDPKAQSALVEVMLELQARKESGISDWHIA